MSITSSADRANDSVTKAHIEERVSEFILKQFPAARSRGIGVDDSLLTQGIIDSLGVLEVVTFIEREFQLTVAEDELLSDHFESIAQIARLVSQKIAPEDPTWTS